MKILLFIIMIISLSGCAMVQPMIAGAGPRHIIILDNFGAADTQAIAESHCQGQRMHAQFSRYVNQPAACYNGQCQYFVCVP